MSKSKYIEIDSGTVDESTIDAALSEASDRFNISRRELDQMALSASPVGWRSGDISLRCEALAEVVKRLAAGGADHIAQLTRQQYNSTGSFSSTDEMISDYLRRFPPDPLKLTAPGNADVGQEPPSRERSPADVDLELARLANLHPKSGIDLQRCVGGSMRSTPPAALSRSDRLYDTDEVRLTAGEAAQEVIRLSSGQQVTDPRIDAIMKRNAGLFGLSSSAAVDEGGQSGPDRLDELDEFPASEPCPVGHDAEATASGSCAECEADRYADQNRQLVESNPSRVVAPTARQRGVSAFAQPDVPSGNIRNAPKSLAVRNREEQASRRPARITH